MNLPNTITVVAGSDHARPVRRAAILAGKLATAVTRLRRLAIVAVACLLPCATMAEDVVIPGSGNPEYVLTLLADAFNRRPTPHIVTIPASTGTAGALRAIESGTAMLARVGRPLSPEERARGLVYVPIGRDPVTFVGGTGVTINGLTAQQAIDIFSGRITNWGELGGQPAPIRAVGREVTDASRRAISNVVKPFGELQYGPGVKIVHFDPQMTELLERFPSSLGFLNRSALHTVKSKLVFLALDGIEATAAAVRSGDYPIWIEFGFIHRQGSLSPGIQAFVDFVRSPAGAAVLRAQGVLVPPFSADVRG